MVTSGGPRSQSRLVQLSIVPPAECRTTVVHRLSTWAAAEPPMASPATTIKAKASPRRITRLRLTFAFMRGQATPLLEQRQFPGEDFAADLELHEVGAARGAPAAGAPPIPGDRDLPGVERPVNQLAHEAPGDIEDSEPHGTSGPGFARHQEADGGGRIEGIGVGRVEHRLEAGARGAERRLLHPDRVERRLVAAGVPHIV